MPLYEYFCEQDGTTIELIRPIAQADAPVEDPQGKGRVFARKLSTFAHQSSGSAGTAARSVSIGGGGGGCGCGKPHGSCHN